MDHFLNDLLMNLLAAGIDAGVLLWTARRREVAPLVVGALLLLLAAGFATPVLFAPNLFSLSRMTAWVLFLHLPFVGLAGAWLLRRDRPTAAVSAGLGLLLAAIGIDAFLIEPRWLEVSRVEVAADGLQEPVRIVVLSDLQTDAVGEWERSVLARVRDEAPDLVLLPGDYIQREDDASYQREARRLHALLREVGVEAPLGVHAVQGNVERAGWTGIFDGIGTAHPRTRTVRAGPLALTALGFEDSRTTDLVVPPQDDYHVVFGHYPDYALGTIGADLLIAGHTHGGQVQLPLLGPIVTLSRVPRSWASGVTQLSPDQTLVVSRGVGLERREAPRLRFLCRPELVVIDLVPGG